MPASGKPQRDLEFLFEMGSIRHIPRMWKRFLGADFANLAEHHFRTCWIAMLLASREGADSGKVAKLAMVHDIAESRSGDVDYLARQYVERNEELGITDMLADTSLATEFESLWEEYQRRESLEARIVKDADNLDIDFELAEQAAKGNQLRKDFIYRKDITNLLFTESAKTIHAQLMADVNPHDWHLNGRNRHNKGEWKGLGNLKK